MRFEYVVSHDSYSQFPRPLLGMPGWDHDPLLAAHTRKKLAFQSLAAKASLTNNLLLLCQDTKRDKIKHSL